jgi:hypothetical protein
MMRGVSEFCRQYDPGFGAHVQEAAHRRAPPAFVGCVVSDSAILVLAGGRVRLERARTTGGGKGQGVNSPR